MKIDFDSFVAGVAVGVGCCLLLDFVMYIRNKMRASTPERLAELVQEHRQKQGT
jgi:hypothetical protein